METWRWGNLLSSDFQNQYQDGTLEVTPDAGNPYRVQKWSDIADIIQGTIILNNTDYLDFMSWYKFNIRQGSVPFTFYDCRYDIDRTARITSQVPSYARVSNKWKVTIKMILDSAIIYEPRLLVLNDAFLVLNNAKLVLNKKLRI